MGGVDWHLVEFDHRAAATDKIGVLVAGQESNCFPEPEDASVLTPEMTGMLGTHPTKGWVGASTYTY